MEHSNISTTKPNHDDSVLIQKWSGVKVSIIKGDITKLQVDAIVNAANSSLLGGGGVDGAIHRVAGSDLLNECKTLNGCATGNAKITKGYLLPAKFVIHTVGPVWQRGNNKETELLASCYTSCLQIAEKYQLVNIAFPNISTGVYGFPKDKAADIAIATVRNYFQKLSNIKEVIFVCFDNENYIIYKEKI